jgi:protein tyrosine phosphatase (PTP) superfamily phosphohydrolase (DUF442 family)
LVVLLALCAATPSTDGPAPVAKAFKPIEDPHLHNAHVVTEKVISGAQPDDEDSFKALHAMGIKTIISVDGAKPDAQTAAKYGMRYIHLPIGYDGVKESDGKAIAKAIDEMPGPIYVHCHHGKHRVAAAVAVACVYNGQLRPDQAESVLQTFGTGANYKGLWKAARDVRPLDPAILDALQIEYVEAARIGELAESMVAVDRHFEHLKLAQKAKWLVPAEHPDIDPAHEALQLQEHFHEAGRMEAVNDRPEDFRKMLTDSDEASKELHEILSAKPLDEAQAFHRIAASCTACHKAYRD